MEAIVWTCSTSCQGWISLQSKLEYKLIETWWQHLVPIFLRRLLVLAQLKRLAKTSWNVAIMSHHVSRGMLVELVSIHPVTMPSRPSMSTHCYYVLPFFPTLRLTLTKDWKVEWVVLPTSAWFNALQVNLYWRVSVIANCLNVPNSLSVLAKHSGSIAVFNSWRDCTNICNAKAANAQQRNTEL